MNKLKKPFSEKGPFLNSHYCVLPGSNREWSGLARQRHTFCVSDQEGDSRGHERRRNRHRGCGPGPPQQPEETPHPSSSLLSLLGAVGVLRDPWSQPARGPGQEEERPLHHHSDWWGRLQSLKWFSLYSQGFNWDSYTRWGQCRWLHLTLSHEDCCLCNKWHPLCNLTTWNSQLAQVLRRGQLFLCRTQGLIKWSEYTFIHFRDSDLLQLNKHQTYLITQRVHEPFFVCMVAVVAKCHLQYD